MGVPCSYLVSQGVYVLLTEGVRSTLDQIAGPVVIRIYHLGHLEQ
jgi:hypothetical protein